MPFRLVKSGTSLKNEMHHRYPRQSLVSLQSAA